MNAEQLKARFPHISPDVIALSASGEPSKQPHRELMAKYGVLQMRQTTDEEKLNKTEKRYLAWLRTFDDAWIGIQCITIKLGHDCRLTPDFWALDATGLRAIDTKGPHVWEDSLIKMRVAARAYPFIRFLLAKEEGGIWVHTEARP